MDLRPVRFDHPDAVELTAAAQRYYVEIYGGPDDDPLSVESFLPPRGGLFLGYVDEVAVAMGGWLFSEETPRPGDAQVRRMFTRPGARRTRAGRRLLEALETDAAAAGATRMVLSTGWRQPDAIAFYRAAGYVDIEPFGYYAGGSGVVCLGKPL